MDSLFTTLTNVNQIVICFIIIVITLVISFVYTFITSLRLRATKSFFLTSCIMPMIVAAIISMVSLFLNNTTSGAIRIATIAVALGLIRFRSTNGRAEELLILFGGIGFGLVAGLGYVAFSAVLAILIAVLYFILSSTRLFEGKRFQGEKLLKVTIPESLEYSDVFDDIFIHYLKNYKLVEVKTTGMGSLFRLSYKIIFKNVYDEKKFIDEIRTRNGNLEISIIPYIGEDKSL